MPSLYSGTRAATARVLIARSLAAVEFGLGTSIAWRLLQIMGAVERFRLGQFEAATIFAAKAMLPQRDVPAAQAIGLSPPALSAVRFEVNALQDCR